jgi:hypothetical protein
MEAYSNSMTNFEASALPVATLKIGPGRETAMFLRFSSADELKSYSDQMSLLGNMTQYLIDVSTMIRYAGSYAPKKTLLRRSRPGQRERLIVESGHKRSLQETTDTIHTLIWEGDREYWQECAAKCSRLSLEGGPGWHDMIIRNSNHEVEITLDTSAAGGSGL